MNICVGVHETGCVDGPGLVKDELDARAVEDNDELDRDICDNVFDGMGSNVGDTLGVWDIFKI